MTATELINHMIPPLKPTDNGHKAIVWMEELRVNQLPVIERGKFKGFITEEIILEENDSSIPISQYELEGQECFVTEDQHFYDVIRVASLHELQMVTVINSHGNFEGVIAIEDTIQAFAESTAVQEPGAILVLLMNQRDYSLAEISRLIESENAKILSSTVNSDAKDHSMLRVTLKLNITEVSHITASLERFGYKIIGRFQEEEIKSNDQERFDMLMRYLNI
ncbi:CBS domain-containing protein [Roseivirga pacifica]|uniref:CBS domain-containing protein n=1 Tax=Roseivirga pacifica TaxID=1267423 RepID=UPI0020948282|nr:CBS domain-containing protein [Roseivirga pacifica]MCO6359436.1 CBS domain-containing protein [Roseivirga pacifica]MCO6366806.1 CBS domain-containing protein [Roseivirga pacifica]MCO6370662.1 CBS domain-containing protein [Roseivirga pacifica]MCO6374462.1 CBS domain-containing protein [Roseivirga pacifica]MCO6379721.1 CBS domain-containing protein [Roseivirga pacifica]